MKDERLFRTLLILFGIWLLAACGGSVKTAPATVKSNSANPSNAVKNTSVIPSQTSNQSSNSQFQVEGNSNTGASKIPNLQTELLDDRNAKTTSPIGTFNFKNHTYPLPRGWKAAGTDELTIENGLLPATDKSIGARYVSTKFGDVSGDGIDEAFVVIKIETEGSAIPQVVYIYSAKEGKPELIWFFRTGDRADGGLKDVRSENGQLVVELYGKDRYLFGEVETLQITGDKEQLCCPEYFTRSVYKWNGKSFIMQGKRNTYSVADPNSLPVENVGDTINDENSKSKR